VPSDRDDCALAEARHGLKVEGGSCLGPTKNFFLPPDASSFAVTSTPQRLSVRAGSRTDVIVAVANSSDRTKLVVFDFFSWPQPRDHRVRRDGRQVGSTPEDGCMHGMTGRLARPNEDPDPYPLDDVVISLDPGGKASARIALEAAVYVPETSDEAKPGGGAGRRCPRALRRLGRMYAGTYTIEIEAPLALSPRPNFSLTMNVVGPKPPRRPKKCDSMPRMGLGSDCALPLSPDA
jgi:hypothetical protein